MKKQLFNKIIETFGTEPVSDTQGIYIKVLLHPDDSIAIYFINADNIKEDLQKRNYRWERLLHAWVKHVATIEEALAETEGYPTTAAALGR